MKSFLLAVTACITLAACSQHFRNGEVRPTPPEMLAGAHADPNAKATAEPAAKPDAKPASTPSDEH